jgi:simple sugar transport system ATP-binding protein
VDLRCGQFSGGNQQKQVLARELGQNPLVLLIGQPTRGVDIGAIEFIHSQIRALRDAGCAVLLVSSELDEILALSDRVLVMNQGEITGELAMGECDETRIGLLMAGSNPASAGAAQQAPVAEGVTP